MSNACRLHYAALHVRVEACCLSVTPLGIAYPLLKPRDCRESSAGIKQLNHVKLANRLIPTRKTILHSV